MNLPHMRRRFDSLADLHFLLVRVFPADIAEIIAFIASVAIISVVEIRLQQPASANQATGGGGGGVPADAAPALLDEHARVLFLLVERVQSAVAVLVVLRLLVREEVLEGVVVDALAVARVLFEEGAHRLGGRAAVWSRGVAGFRHRFAALF